MKSKRYRLEMQLTTQASGLKPQDSYRHRQNNHFHSRYKIGLCLRYQTEGTLELWATRAMPDIHDCGGKYVDACPCRPWFLFKSLIIVHRA